MHVHNQWIINVRLIKCNIETKINSWDHEVQLNCY